MATVKDAVRGQLQSRLSWFGAFVLFVAAVDGITGPTVGGLLESFRPPVLPILDLPENRVSLDQNWDDELSSKFHHISQGSRILPIPLKWFLALEQPASGISTIPFSSKGKFSDNEYLLRFGFIEDSVSDENPHGLPIGFAETPYQSLPGIGNQVTALGFTCAACHTGHLSYNNVEYIIEGGPASADLGQLTKALGAAIGQTLVSSQIPVFNGRFDRFAKSVLGNDGHSDAAVASLRRQLEAVAAYNASLPGDIDVVEGFSRLDALNRIGNSVFALEPGRFENYVPIHAPVTFPHLWTASWFDWVQYNGSIMGPLIRNTGEAMGLNASVNTTAPPDENRFSTSIDVNNLWWIENALSGDSPLPEKRFSGLLSPRWPAAFGVPDDKMVARGREIYQEICIHCHLPTLDSGDIWTDEYFSPVKYFIDGVEHSTPDALLRLNLIAIEQVGTDPEQANVLHQRTVNTAGDGGGSIPSNTHGMGINTQVCTLAPTTPAQPSREPDYVQVYAGIKTSELVQITVRDGPALNFGEALGALVQQVNEQWFDQNFIPEEGRAFYREDRPNCLRAEYAYKARPLNGIWATAPFLHNGSIPSLVDLLSAPSTRPKFVQLGSIEFDVHKVGIKQNPNLRYSLDQKYASNGLFILDTSIPGNSNQGHEFSSRWDPEKPWDEQIPGLLGPEFSADDVLSVVEFLKTL